jgi:hypothetical protein
LALSHGDAAKVSVFEPVAVAFDGDDFGVVDASHRTTAATEAGRWGEVKRR